MRVWCEEIKRLLRLEPTRDVEEEGLTSDEVMKMLGSDEIDAAGNDEGTGKIRGREVVG